jgi:Uma2 family endonuclease
MSIQPDLPNLPMDKAAFLAWHRRNEGRYELAGGRVVMMTGASRRHGKIVGNLHVALRRQLDRASWDVITEFGLDAGPETLRYPDIVVDRAKADGDAQDYATSTPILLIEVLSPSSVAIDLGDKSTEYLRLPDLQAYIVLSQDEPKAWVWQRTNEKFMPGSEIVERIESTVRIAALGVELTMAEVYAGVRFG